MKKEDKIILENKIKEFEQEYITYRNICYFKLKAIKDNSYIEQKKCAVCSGYSTICECDDYVDMQHLIKFYKEFII